MPASDIIDVSVRDPQVDDRLRFQDRTWEITNRATYSNDKGYRTIEWCCETANIEAYLLKEFEGDRPPRWFFTRWLSHSNATIDGSSIETWVKKHPGQTPAAIQYQGVLYTYKDKTEGIYENDELGRQNKITWDCWDMDHRVNLAIELWESGRIDLYRGSYAEASNFILLNAPADHPFAQLQALSTDPQSAMGVLVVGFFLFFLAATTVPFEMILAWSLSLAFAGVAVLALMQVPALTVSAVVLVAGGLFFFGRFAPLTTVPGFVTALGLPLIFAFYARWYGHAEEHRNVVQYLAAWTSAMPIMIHGFYIYFHYAPGPRTFSEMLMAILPAAIVGGLGAVIALVIISEDAGHGHFSPGASG